MTLIDQRILIDAPPQVVWDYISDPAKMSYWHVGYRSVSVLTTRQTGSGTRRRCTPSAGGKDVIEAITTWVDGLGYEYEITEGGPYRSFQGRFRLQTSPDGTSVQWTLFYKPKGLIGIVKDRLAGRRQMADMMADSLRQLRRRIDELGQRMDAENRAKVAIQGRLNADERAHYQRRHPAPLGAENGTPVQAEVPPAPAPGAVITPGAALPAAAVPSFVADLTAETEGLDYSHTADTEPKPPAGLREAIAAQQAGPAVPAVTTSAEPLQPGTVKETDREAQPTPAVPPSPFARPEPPLPPLPPPERLAPPPAPVSKTGPDYQRPTPARGIPSVKPGTPLTPAEPLPPASQEKPAAEPPRPGLPPPVPKQDTGEVSIWQIFGLRRPSEQDAEVLDDLIQTVRKKQTAEMQVVRPDRVRQRAKVRQIQTVVGLRFKLALRRVRVRLYGK